MQQWLFIGVAALFAGLGYLFGATHTLDAGVTPIAMIGFGTIIVIMLGFAAMVLFKIGAGDIKLDGLISEPVDSKQPGSTPGKASLARFQFLLFTFVIAGLFLLLSIEHGAFVEIPETVLGLIGISGGSFLVSKGINKS